MPHLSEATSKLSENIPYVGHAASTLSGTLGGAIAYETACDALVCFDDFERSGDSLKPKDMLGLITQPREERDCDVALILNYSQLDNDEEDFLKHSEKAIDLHVLSQPSHKKLLT